MRTLGKLFLALSLVVGTFVLTAVPASAKTIKPKISLTVSPSKVDRGGTVTAKGTLSTSPKGTTVKVQRRSGSKWVTIKSTRTTSSKGAYSTSFKVSSTSIGTYSYRTYVAKKGSRKAATSSTKKVSSRVVITTPAQLADTTVDQPLSLQLTRSPATVAGTWKILRGAPSTITLSSGGLLSGTPTASADYAITVRFTPASGGTFTEKALALSVVPPATPSITTTSLPDGTVGVPYSAQLDSTVTGSWSEAVPSLPAGLSLTSAGAITGNPTAAGDSTLQARLTVDGNTYDKALPIHVDAAPVVPVTGPDVVSAGGEHVCRVKPDHTLWCWGSNNKEQLGTGTFDLQNPEKRTPQRVGTDANWSTVSAGRTSVFGFTCATKTDFSLWCWGSDFDQQLGNGSGQAQVGTPHRIGTDKNWSTVAAGEQQACALTTSKELWCWGGIGNGIDVAGVDTTVPARVGTDSDWTSVAAGGSHTCGLRQTGALYCWGYNYRGQLGTGAGSPSTNLAPVRVGSSTQWTAVSAGAAHTCGIDAGVVKCWGANADGRIGDGSTGTDRTTPTTVSGLPNTASWTSVAAGGGGNPGHSCAAGSGTGGGVYCWGANDNGQLGDGTTTSRALPVLVTGSAATWTSLSAGGQFTYAVRPSLGLSGWGDNGKGEIGVGSPATRFLTPQSLS